MTLPTAVLGSLGWAWALPLVAAGAFLWTFGEYTLHRFGMHELNGRGILSREHLEHHVTASWGFDPLMMLAWVGVILVGVVGWGTLGVVLGGPVVGASLAIGWIAGYAGYEFLHARAHLVGPSSGYTRWLRKHHFHHHFGHPMSNHGVSIGLWDRIFGTLDVPELVKVPRRMAPVWMLDDEGQLLPAYVDDYVLVGVVNRDDRLAALDRARAFASLAPTAA